MKKFQLELHPEKTRLLEFGRFAARDREKRGQGKPETFDFLGFTHICGKTRKGRFAVLRQTIRKRLLAKLGEVKAELRRRMHDPVPEVGQWLKAVVSGHIRYYGVPTNSPALNRFRFAVGDLWHHVLSRRSQKRSCPLAEDETTHQLLAPSGPNLPSLSVVSRERHYLRQEPGAGNPLVRIRAGGTE